MNAITDTPTLTPAQSLRRLIDWQATHVQTEGHRIATLASAARDACDISAHETEKVRVALGQIIDLVELIELQAEKVQETGEAIERLTSQIREAVA